MYFIIKLDSKLEREREIITLIKIIIIINFVILFILQSNHQIGFKSRGRYVHEIQSSLRFLGRSYPLCFLQIWELHLKNCCFPSSCSLSNLAKSPKPRNPPPIHRLLRVYHPISKKYRTVEVCFNNKPDIEADLSQRDVFLLT